MRFISSVNIFRSRSFHFHFSLYKYLSIGGDIFFIKVENLFNVTIHTFLNKLTLGDLEQAAGKWHTLHSL